MASSTFHAAENPLTTLSKVRFNVGPTGALFLMMGLVAIMGLVSLTHLNSMSTKGYAYAKLEDDYQELVSDGELNDMMILQARSMQTIEQDTRVQAMVQPTHIYYMESVTGIAQAN